MRVTLRDLHAYIQAEDFKDRKLLDTLADILFETHGSQLLGELTKIQLTHLLTEALRFIGSRKDQPYRVRCYNPCIEEEGWTSQHTALEFVLADRPFVVSSIQLLLHRKGIRVHQMIHPILNVERDEEGCLRDLHPGPSEESGPEAYQLLLIDRRESKADLEELAEEVRQVLRSLIEVTSDYSAMRGECLELQKWLSGEHQKQDLEPSLPEPPSLLREYRDFLDWLCRGHFVFLGYREYQVAERDGRRLASVRPESGKGILRDPSSSKFLQPVPLDQLPEEIQRQVSGPPVLLVTKTNSESPLHRDALMEYIGVKIFDEQGSLTGERRFLGLFTAKAFASPASEIPILRMKLQQVLERDRARRGSHDFKQMVNLFNSMPLGELFMLEPRELHQDIRTMMESSLDRQVRLKIRLDPLGRGFIAMVLMPREKFNSDVRRKVQDFLTERLEASQVDYQLAMGGGEDMEVRFHFFLASSLSFDRIEPSVLEEQLARIVRTWDDRLEEELQARHGDRGGRLARRYQQLFTDGYKAEVPITNAVRDVENLERLGDSPFLVDLINPTETKYVLPTTHLRIYHPGSLALHEIFPILENLGLRVYEQISYQVLSAPLSTGVGGLEYSIDIFRVQNEEGLPIDIGGEGPRLTEALKALLQKSALNDRLNRLVLSAGLTIRQVMLLETLRGFLFQISPATSLTFITDTLTKYPQVTRKLFAYFSARFDPSLESVRETRTEGMRQELLEALFQVNTLPEDEIYRGMLEILESILRTNYFKDRSYLSIKVASRRLQGIPEPKPFVEVFVMGLDFQGIHLRGAKIARGGLRWSDRPDDFRTEVLGLMKTQVTKNALIVPSGSKGAFVLRAEPQDPQLLQEHARNQYRLFIRGILDLTDNFVDGEPRMAEGIVIYDDFDPYLVVAADKGTATFSDLANEVSRQYGFWLGDAFASGGSYGYDHKREGITARGTWEGVKRHFRELGIDPHETPFTVAGIGDMSGDVFGNGMLYSDQICLLAAFDHRHIFIDPAPDPLSSFQERTRLFELPRSSWADYREEALSPGGGIYPRHSKSIKLSAESCSLLGLENSEISGRQLVREILKLPVDLLWNGGIGTYVKAATEPDNMVGDPSNNPVRITARELQAKVIGEGGNLGLTQLARVEYASRGGRMNTDALDNSAGVDMSDHEVNIKIALQREMDRAGLSFSERNHLLEEMTDDVTQLVLRNNYTQNYALSLAERRGIHAVPLFSALQQRLTEEGQLNPQVEFLPTQKGLDARLAKGKGYTRPELAILMAYSKIHTKRLLLGSPFLDEDGLETYLLSYFPEKMAVDFRDALLNHPLRREIVATRLANLIIDRLGLTFGYDLSTDCFASEEEVLRVVVASIEILDLASFFARLDDQETRLDVDDHYAATYEVRKAVRDVASWLLHGGRSFESVDQMVSIYRDPLRSVRCGLAEWLPRDGEFERLEKKRSAYRDMGFSGDLVEELAVAPYFASCMGVVDTTEKAEDSIDRSARIFYKIGERFSLGQIRDQLLPGSGSDPADRMARASLVANLRRLQVDLATSFLRLGLDDFRDLAKTPTALLAKIDEFQRRVDAARVTDLADATVISDLLHQLSRSMAR